MTIASSALTRTSYVAEGTWGTTPSTPIFKVARFTKAGDWDPGKATEKSGEMRGDRNVTDEMLLGFDPKGTYNFELSYGGLDDLLEVAFFSAWSSNVLKNGVTRKSLTLEETLSKGALNLFRRYPGAMIDTFNLDITARRPITGSMGVLAQKVVTDTAIVTGATYIAPGATTPMTASASVANLTVTALTGLKVQSLSLAIANNLAARALVGTLFSDEFREGDFDVTGTVTAYVESNAILDAVLAHGGGAISATLGHATNQKYTLSLPNVQFLNGTERVGGKDDDLMATIPFRAKLDSGVGASVQLTRAVA